MRAGFGTGDDKPTGVAEVSVSRRHRKVAFVFLAPLFKLRHDPRRTVVAHTLRVV
jgi:hypothetical protein